MKACLVSDRLPGFHKPWSGAELMCWRLAQMLREDGQEVFLLATKFQKTVASPEWICEASIPLLQKMPALVTLLVFDPFALLSCIQILRRKRPDIVHLHAVGLFLPALIAAKFAGIPVVMTVLDHLIFCPYSSLRKPNGEICTTYHGTQCAECGKPSRNPFRLGARKLAGYWRSKIYGYFVRRLDAIVVLSRTSKLRLEQYGIPNNRIKMIYHYRVDSHESDHRSVSPAHSKNSILFVGSLNELRGLHVVIQAMRDVVNQVPEARLRVVGSEEDIQYTTRIKEMMAELGLDNHVSLLGQRPNEQVISLILDSNLVVVPLQWPNEFGPMILVEAMSLAKPIVGSRIGAIPELIEDGSNGFLAAYDKPEQFSEKIIWLLKNPKSARAMGERAQKSVQRLYENDPVTEMVDLYRSVAATN